MWKCFHAKNGGVLVVGHGTRVATGVAQLIDLANQLQTHFGEIPVEPGFLELAEPTILQALNRLRSRGVSCVMVVPILLFEAAHARSDIPDAVQLAANSLGLSVLAQSPPLGTADAALTLSDFRFAEALRCTNEKGCLMAGGCDRVAQCFASGNISEQRNRSDDFRRAPPRIGLAMVGRGTSDQTALEQMRRFTSLRIARSKTQMSWVETGFFAGGEPTVDQLLDSALHSNCDTLIVQPHLLFEGELVRQLREKVSQRQPLSTNQRWFVTPALGADPRLALAFFELASQSIKEKLASIS